MTREEFAAEIDAVHARERARWLACYDRGLAQYGQLNLLTDTRDFLEEARQEEDDRRIYLIFDAVRRRLLGP